LIEGFHDVFGKPGDLLVYQIPSFRRREKGYHELFRQNQAFEGLELERASPEITDNVGLAGATDSTSPFQVFLQ